MLMFTVNANFISDKFLTF